MAEKELQFVREAFQTIKQSGKKNYLT